MYGNFKGTNIKINISNLLFKFVSLNIKFWMILCAGLQLSYKLSQLSVRYNKHFSFNISKFYSEHFTTTDSKFCNFFKEEFFQVASNCYFNTAWKVSVVGVILVCIFPHSDWIRRDKYLSVSSPNAGKCGPQ